jgi:hypothetical protein
MVAQGEGVASLVAELRPDNVRMRDLLAEEGFSFTEREASLEASLALR